MQFFKLSKINDVGYNSDFTQLAIFYSTNFLFAQNSFMITLKAFKMFIWNRACLEFKLDLVELGIKFGMDLVECNDTK